MGYCCPHTPCPCCRRAGEGCCPHPPCCCCRRAGRTTTSSLSALPGTHDSTNFIVSRRTWGFSIHERGELNEHQRSPLMNTFFFWEVRKLQEAAHPIRFTITNPNICKPCSPASRDVVLGEPRSRRFRNAPLDLQARKWPRVQGTRTHRTRVGGTHASTDVFMCSI